MSMTSVGEKSYKLSTFSFMLIVYFLSFLVVIFWIQGINVDSKKDNPAYLISNSYFINGQTSLLASNDTVQNLFKKAGAKILVAGNVEQKLIQIGGKLQAGTRITIIKFPSMKNLLDVWNSEACQAILSKQAYTTDSCFTLATEGDSSFLLETK